jgi:hypothetical protein
MIKVLSVRLPTYGNQGSTQREARSPVHLTRQASACCNDGVPGAVR